MPEAGFIPSLLKAVRARTAISQGAEITCEANPGTLTHAHIHAWREAGVNRLSLGAQAVQDRLLAMLGRIHQWEDVREAARLWGEPESLSLDLMYGLPGQTLMDWGETLDAAMMLAPGHVSCYSLIVEERTPMHSALQSGEKMLPAEEDERAMYSMAQAILASAGYEQYEISNWARNGRVCRHNLNTWQRKQYIGLGCAAASFWKGVRMRNTCALQEYLRGIGNGKPVCAEHVRISREEALFEELMLGLRLTQGTVLSPDAWEAYAEKLTLLCAQNLMIAEGRRVRLTARGADVMNAVLVNLME